jgi:hypothetical protein
MTRSLPYFHSGKARAKTALPFEVRATVRWRRSLPLLSFTKRRSNRGFRLRASVVLSMTRARKITDMLAGPSVATAAETTPGVRRAGAVP